jgi:hypothetical protein
MLRVTDISIMLVFASFQVLIAQDPQETKKTSRIVIGGGKVSIPEEHKQLGQKQKPSESDYQKELLKARRERRAYLDNLSKAKAKGTADAVALAGSRAVAGVVQKSRDTAIQQIRDLNRVAGRSSSSEMTSNEKAVALGYQPRSYNYFIDSANDTITNKIVMILSDDPDGMSLIVLAARLMAIAESNLSNANYRPITENSGLSKLQAYLTLVETHLNQLVSSGKVRKKTITLGVRNIYSVY